MDHNTSANSRSAGQDDDPEISSPSLSPISRASDSGSMSSLSARRRAIREHFRSFDQNNPGSQSPAGEGFESPPSVARHLSFDDADSDYSDYSYYSDNDNYSYYVIIRDEEGVAWGSDFYGSEPILAVKHYYASEKNEERLSLDTELYVKGRKTALDNGVTIETLFKELGLSKKTALDLSAKHVPFSGPLEVEVRPFWGWAGVAGLTKKFGPSFLNFWITKPTKVKTVLERVHSSPKYPFDERGEIKLYSTTWSRDGPEIAGPPLSNRKIINDLPDAYAIAWSPEAEAHMYPSGRIDPSVNKNPRAGRIVLAIGLTNVPERWCISKTQKAGYDWDGDMPALAPAAGGSKARRGKKLLKKSVRTRKDRKSRKSRKSSKIKSSRATRRL